MRLTSAFWVAALVRRVQQAGGYAVIQRRGDSQAGSVYVVVDRLDGSIDLYAPAPQSLYDGESQGERLLVCILERVGWPDITLRLEREGGFDPDLWVIVIEDREGRRLWENP